MLGLEQLGRINPRHEYGAWHVSRGTDLFLSKDYAGLVSSMARAAYTHSLPPGKTHLLDKTPAYFWIIDYLHRTMPGANRLVLLRNPLSIAASFKSTWNMDLGDGLLNNSEIMLMQCFVAIERVRAFAQQQLATNPALVVDYDGLVSDPGPTIKRILQAIEVDTATIDWDALSHINSGDLTATGFGDRKILETSQVHTQSRSAWRSILTDQEAALIVSYFGLTDPELDVLSDAHGAAARAGDLRAHLNSALEQRRYDYRRSYEQRMYNSTVNEDIHKLYAQID